MGKCNGESNGLPSANSFLHMGISTKTTPGQDEEIDELPFGMQSYISSVTFHSRQPRQAFVCHMDPSVFTSPASNRLSLSLEPARVMSIKFFHFAVFELHAIGYSRASLTDRVAFHKGFQHFLDRENLSFELNLSLEALGRPFVWVVRSSVSDEELELVSWTRDPQVAPAQVIVLSYPSVGGFVMNYEWN
ncbi:UDP-Glycosyltransferase superfamily protein [Striga asiatica]|uniref:UDP-Glycosyltransferase superfamily protein n=1 Tax=Striga asiatica TaxID=4170 RepID=A0A5A7PSB5_STRAF|nr:UDP-Glycosyltransferase superfamily protein [Striga asiatica]